MPSSPNIIRMKLSKPEIPTDEVMLEEEILVLQAFTIPDPPI